MASKRRPEDKEELASEQGVKSGGREIIPSSGRNICESPGAQGAQSIQICRTSSRIRSEKCIEGEGEAEDEPRERSRVQSNRALETTFRSFDCSQSNVLDARRSFWPRVDNGLISDENHYITIHPEPSLTMLVLADRG